MDRLSLLVYANTFLSTLPAWGATTRRVNATVERLNFYPRSPRGERPIVRCEKCVLHGFLSTLPAWGATIMGTAPSATELIFLSTLPAWGATGQLVEHRGVAAISIHAPRVGSDLATLTFCALFGVISIHAPRVGSDQLAQGSLSPHVISIHAPRVGSDPWGSALRSS